MRLRGDRNLARERNANIASASAGACSSLYSGVKIITIVDRIPPPPHIHISRSARWSSPNAIPRKEGRDIGAVLEHATALPLELRVATVALTALLISSCSVLAQRPEHIRPHSTLVIASELVFSDATPSTCTGMSPSDPPCSRVGKLEHLETNPRAVELQRSVVASSSSGEYIFSQHFLTEYFTNIINY